MITILKFFTNDGKQSNVLKNDIISRTLLKIAVINKYYIEKNPEKLPKSGELWKCDIIKETCGGKNKGCFIVDPLEKVEENDIMHLIPGFFYQKVLNNRLIIIPKKPELNWILPLTHKHLYTEEVKAYCVIVQLDVTQEELLELEKQSQERIKKLNEDLSEQNIAENQYASAQSIKNISDPIVEKLK
jgi:hypothetical protein